VWLPIMDPPASPEPKATQTNGEGDTIRPVDTPTGRELETASPQSAAKPSFKDVGQDALRRQQKLEQTTILYMANPQVAHLIFEPTHQNHLVEATYSIFRQFIMKHDWYVKRLKASEDEKRVYKSAGTSPKYWTFVAKSQQILKDALVKGYVIRVPPADADDGTSTKDRDGGGGSSSKSHKRAAKVVDPNKPKNKPTPYINFCNAKRNEVKSQHPSASFAELGRLFGIEWAKLDDAEKSIYVSPSDPPLAAGMDGSGAGAGAVGAVVAGAVVAGAGAGAGAVAGAVAGTVAGTVAGSSSSSDAAPVVVVADAMVVDEVGEGES